MTDTNTPMSGSNMTPAFRRIRALLDKHKATMNKEELAILVVGACIVEGMDSGSRITGAAACMGLNKRYVGKVLADLTGQDPVRHRWCKTKDGRYRLHDPSVRLPQM